MTNTRLIVFSDLDGTLLDHQSYSFDPARPALNRLKMAGHVLVLASSKTAAEIAPLREAMGFAHCPAIVENGSGVLEPGYNGQGSGGDEHGRILTALDGLPTELRSSFSGFSDWTVNVVMERTGLSELAAKQAKTRWFSEPGEWTGTEDSLRAFTKELSQHGISAIKGGRFLTLSHGKTKASQMDVVLSRYRSQGEPVSTIALGDAPNDIAMLEKADLGVIIGNPAHAGIKLLPSEETGQIIRSRSHGPVGWNEELTRILDRN